MRACSALFAILVVSLASAAEAQSRRALAELGRLEPPAYAAPLTRAGEPAPVFDEAMAAYQRRDYQRTADLLRRFAAVEPEDPAGNFFLAVSLMMIDEVGEAEDRLGVVVAGADAATSAFVDAAKFVMAKASIRTGRLDAAGRELERLSRGESLFARDAALLLPKVRALEKRR